MEEARHVEVQVLGDRNGMRVHLGERDCSVQRRHQKLLEESPAPAIRRETRAGLCKAALAVANAVNYVSAGTVEFLVDRDGSFYFIEMNTRIQVEHPVTEMVTGIDLVREQIRIAAGEPLGYKQDAVRFTRPRHRVPHQRRGSGALHALPGPRDRLDRPGRPGVRVDSHLMAGYVVPPYYDSLIAKIIVHGQRSRRGDRPHAPGALRDRGRGGEDHDPLSPEAAGRPGVRGGRVHAAPGSSRPL